MIDTLIFDLDGTLLNTLDDLQASVNFALEKSGYPLRTLEEIKSFVGNGVARLVYLSVPEGTNKEQADKCLEIFKEHYKENSAVKTAPYEGTVDMLKKAKSMGFKTAVVTNKIEEAAIDVVNFYFPHLIDVIIGQVDGIAQKPAPDGVYKAISLLNSEKEKCIYIGDSDVDCKTGHNAGLKVIGVTWGFRGKNVLIENGAEYIIDYPHSIFDIIIDNKSI